MRNKICFEGKELHDHLEIVCHACALIKLWAGLPKEVDKEMLIQGVDAMFKIAVQLLSRSVQPSTSLTCCKMLTPMMKLIKAQNDDKAWEAGCLKLTKLFC
jgi:hypothetical protein